VFFITNIVKKMTVIKDILFDYELIQVIVDIELHYHI